MRGLFITAICLLFAMNCAVHATNVQFGKYTGNFGDASKWWDPNSKTNHVPTIRDTALFFTTAVCTVQAGTSYAIDEVYLGEYCHGLNPANSVSQLIINGSLTATTYSVVGCTGTTGDRMTGLLTINEGGSLTILSGLMVGKGNNGTIVMNGGEMNITYWLALGCDAWKNDDVNTPGTGILYLNGGLAHMNQLYMGLDNDISQIIVSDGVLEIMQAVRVPAFLARNQIVAAEGYKLNIDYSYNQGFGVRITAEGPLKGDLDGNKKVNLKDFAVLAKWWADGTNL